MNQITSLFSVATMLVVVTISLSGAVCDAAHPLAAPGGTSLTDSDVTYQVTDKHHVVLQRGDVTAIIVGLFWASYIHQPEEKAIHFQGRLRDSDSPATWIKAITPKHGIDSTHPPAGYSNDVQVDDDFPLKLVNHPSKIDTCSVRMSWESEELK